MARISFGMAALGQVAVVVAIIMVIAAWPPRRGAMLMIPLNGHAASVVNVATAADAGLLAMGPLPGSVIVVGDRAALSGPALAQGILLLAAPRAICGVATGSVG